jgi:hypothetical protein
MRNIVFVQVSHKLTAPHNAGLEYYKQAYAKCEGFMMPEHFMELPTWVAVASGLLPDDKFHKSLHIVTSVDESREFLRSQHWDTVILASAMDVNKHVLKRLVMDTGHTWVLGGYVDPALFRREPNVVWLSSMSLLRHAIPGALESADPNYSLFHGMGTVPRLTLSEGCLYNCSFCTVPRQVTERNMEDVIGQLESFRSLKYKLVYLNDKTFGQAKNYKWLPRLGEAIWNTHPEFQGFIVQTTVSDALKHLDEWKDFPIRYIEVGVEHVDDKYLHEMRKPYQVKQLLELGFKLRTLKAQGYDIGFIPNVMFSLPSADYKSTSEWVEMEASIISFINPFILCAYHDAHGNLVSYRQPSDADENDLVKSWLTPVELQDNQKAWDLITQLSLGE